MISIRKVLLQPGLFTVFAAWLYAQAPELSRAVELVAKRDFKRAEGVLNEILRTRPAEADALNLMGVIAAEEGEAETAKTWFEKALKANPKLAGAYLNLGYLAKRGGEAESALKCFEKAAELAPGDPEALLNSAILLADGKRFKEAVQALSNVPEDYRTARHWETLGRIQMTIGSASEAEESYGKALEKDPQSIETLRVLSGLALRRNDSRRAWEYIAQARKLAPNSAQLLYEFGQVSLANNLPREALFAFRRAITMDETRPEYYAGLIEAYWATTDYPLVEPYIEKYIQLRPEDAWGYHMKGQLLFLAAKLDEAEPLFRRAHELDPKQADPTLYLGRVAYNRGDIDLAERLFLEALAKNPDHAPAYLRLGMLHVRKAEYEKAEKELRRSAELDPREPTTHLQLSLVLGRIGKTEEAKAERERHDKLKADREQRITEGSATPFSLPVKKQ